LPCCQHETIIEFRPLNTWRGEFGFDWLRVYEGKSSRQIPSHIDATGWRFDHLNNYEKPYIDGASGAAQGYPLLPYPLTTPNAAPRERPTLPSDPPPVPGVGMVIGAHKSLLEQMPPADARRRIGNEYIRMPIARPGPLSYRLDTYFVPYLNLFPEQDASGAPLGGQALPPNPRLAFSPPAPPSPTPAPPPPPIALTPPVRRCEAELQVLYDIKNQKPGKIAIEYDPTLFAITGSGSSSPKAGSTNVHEYIIPDSQYGITPATYQDSVKVAETIRIKCLREIGTLFQPDYKLNVVAYPANPQPGDGGTVVGMLNVCGNSAIFRKEIKIALVKVITNIGQTSATQTGVFNMDEVNALYHTLHQALITPDIISKDEQGNDYILDLTNDPKFHAARGRAGFIRPGPRNSNIAHLIDPRGFKSHLLNAFKSQLAAKGLNAITDRFLVFAFDENATVGGIAFSNGVNERIVHNGSTVRINQIYWLPATAIFTRRSTGVLAHEQLHALTLRHTHSDWDATPTRSVPITPNCKYIFPYKATTNVMSYNHRNMYSTWRWQWEIMRRNVDVDWNGKRE
jgi:hypothetical protein